MVRCYGCGGWLDEDSEYAFVDEDGNYFCEDCAVLCENCKCISTPSFNFSNYFFILRNGSLWTVALCKNCFDYYQMKKSTKEQALEKTGYDALFFYPTDHIEEFLELYPNATIFD